LWRLRQRGALPRPTKVGGTGQNLTRREDVLAAEGVAGRAA
jgi:hypothetical protein